MINYLLLLHSATEFYFEQECNFDYFKNKDFDFAQKHLIEQIESRENYLKKSENSIKILINHFATDWQETGVPDIATYYYDILGEIENQILDCQKVVEKINDLSELRSMTTDEKIKEITKTLDILGDTYAKRNEEAVNCCSFDTKFLVLTRYGYKMTEEERAHWLNEI